jgi:hypothetical protein
MRQRLFLIVGVLAVVALAGFVLVTRSRPGDRPPALKPADILAAEDFTFTLAEGGWPLGFDVLQVSATGEATYVFDRGHQDWRKARFHVEPGTLGALRRLVAEGGYLTLRDKYVDERVSDGNHWAFRVSAGGASKALWCGNTLPDSAKQLSQFAHDRILAAHAQQIQAAKKADTADAIELLRDLPVWR